MHEQLKTAGTIIKELQHHGIDPILYGSLGVSFYLGDFKKFGDVDLLVPEPWVNTQWQNLMIIMNELGYTLFDEHEHEFIDKTGGHVAFASENVLVRDGISQSPIADVAIMNIGDIKVRTLNLATFKRAYEFSSKDGYRQNQREKKDSEVIALINKQLADDQL